MLERRLAAANAVAFSAAQGLAITLYPLLAERTGLSLATLVACFGVGSFLFLFGAPAWSAKSDEWGRVRVLAFGSLALAVSLFSLWLLVVVPSISSGVAFAILSAGRVVYGLGASALVPVSQALREDLSAPAERARAMLDHSLGLGFGRVAGVAAVVLFAEEATRLVACALVLVAALVAVNFSARASGPAPRPASGRSRAPKADTLPVGILVVAFLFAIFAEALNSSLGGTLQAAFALDGVGASALGGRVLLAASVGVFVVQALARGLWRPAPRRALVVGALSLAAGASLFFSLGSFAALSLATAFFVVGLGLVPPAYLALSRPSADSTSVGRRAGRLASVQTLGYAVGALVSAFAFRFGGGAIAPWLLGLALGIAAWAALRQGAWLPLRTEKSA